MNMFKDGSLIVGFVQHSALSLHMLTCKLITLSYTYMVQLLMAGNNDEYFNECVSEMLPQVDMTGREFVKLLIPNYDGVSIITKSTINHMCGQMILSIWRRDACRRIGFIVRVLQEYVLHAGSSMGIDDVIVQGCIPPGLHNTMDKVTDQMNSLMLQKDTEPVSMVKAIDAKYTELSDALRDISGDFMTQELRKRESSLLTIIESGAKGNATHIVQNTATVGQQLDRLSARPNRLCSHSGSLSTLEGYVKNSFIDGLSAIEFFHHVAVSRLGLVATAVSTSDVGYLYRCIAKSCEDLRSIFNTTIVDALGNIVFFKFGFATEHLIVQPLEILKYSQQEIVQRYMLCTEDPKALEAAQCEVKRLLCLQERVLETKQIVSHCYSPLDFKFTRAHFGPVDSESGNVDPVELIQTVADFWIRLVQEFHIPDTMHFEALFIERLSSYNITRVGVKTKRQLQTLLRHVFDIVSSNVLPTATAIGLRASQNLSSPITQMSLNSFHLSGQKTKVTSGVARIKEILNLTKNISTPSMQVYLKTGHTLTGIDLVQLRLMDIFEGWYLDENLLVLCLNSDLLMERVITPQEVGKFIVDLMRITNERVVFSSVLAEEWTVSITLAPEDDCLTLAHSITSDTRLIKGICNIVDFYECQESVKVYDGDQLTNVVFDVIVTMGSNIVDICKLEAVNTVHTVTNDILETFETLGIDATKVAIERNLLDVLSNNSTTVSVKSIELIASLMTTTGRPCALTFAGMNTANVSKLKMASFERSLDSFISAATHGHVDNLHGISEAQLCGNRISVGTGGNSTLINIPGRRLKKKHKMFKSLSQTYSSMVHTGSKLNINPDNARVLCQSLYPEMFSKHITEDVKKTIKRHHPNTAANPYTKKKIKTVHNKQPPKASTKAQENSSALSMNPPTVSNSSRTPRKKKHRGSEIPSIDMCVQSIRSFGTLLAPGQNALIPSSPVYQQQKTMTRQYSISQLNIPFKPSSP